MGGNALKIETERMDKATHSRISKHVIDTLAADNITANVTEHYRLKETFGDIDILVVEDSTIKWYDYIVEKFTPASIFVNGTAADNVYSYSFNIEKYQVDLLIVKKELYETTQFYYSCGMFGDPVGRVAMSLGAKFGVFGLEYRHNKKNTTQRIGTINLSTDKYEILQALGFSIERFDEGFDTVQDMFEFIISSSYFNIYYFDFDNLNAAKRAKNLRRKEYVEFLEYVQNNRPDVLEKNKLPAEVQMQWMVDKFPKANLQNKILEIEKLEEDKVKAKAKFNGTIVMERLGLVNNQLNFLSDFTRSHENYTEYILNTDLDTIIQDVSKFREDKIKKGAS